MSFILLTKQTCSSLNCVLLIIMAKSKKAKRAEKKRQTCVYLYLGCLKVSHLQVGRRGWYFVVGYVVSRAKKLRCLFVWVSECMQSQLHWESSTRLPLVCLLFSISCSWFSSITYFFKKLICLFISSWQCGAAGQRVQSLLSNFADVLKMN